MSSTRRRQWHPTPVLLPRKSHGQRSLVGCSPWGRQSGTRLSDFTFTFHFHTLAKEMATHSSVLAWRIPGTGEPGGPPSMGSHRVGHDWSDLAVAELTKYRIVGFKPQRGSCSSAILFLTNHEVLLLHSVHLVVAKLDLFFFLFLFYLFIHFHVY